MRKFHRTNDSGLGISPQGEDRSIDILSYPGALPGKLALVVTRDLLEEDQSEESYVELRLERLRATLPQFRMIGRKKTLTDHPSGREAEVAWTSDGRPMVLRQTYLFRGIRIVILTATASERFSEEHEQSLRQLIRSFRSTREQFGDRVSDGGADNDPASAIAARDDYSSPQLYRLHRALEFCRQIVWLATRKNITPDQMERIAAGSRAYDPEDGTIHSEIPDILSLAGVPAHSEPGAPWNIQRALHQRRGIISGHDAGILWRSEQHRGENHAVHTTGLIADSNGRVTHYIINDIGFDEEGREVPAKTYEESLKRGSITVTDEPIW